MWANYDQLTLQYQRIIADNEQRLCRQEMAITRLLMAGQNTTAEEADLKRLFDILNKYHGLHSAVLSALRRIKQMYL